MSEERDGKYWWQSMTAWVAILTFAASLLEFVRDQPMVANNAKAVAIIGMVLGVVTLGLRLITKQPIKSSLRGPGR